MILSRARCTRFDVTITTNDDGDTAVTGRLRFVGLLTEELAQSLKIKKTAFSEGASKFVVDPEETTIALEAVDAQVGFGESDFDPKAKADVSGDTYLRIPAATLYQVQCTRTRKNTITAVLTCSFSASHCAAAFQLATELNENLLNLIINPSQQSLDIPANAPPEEG